MLQSVVGAFVLAGMNITFPREHGKKSALLQAPGVSLR